jgi:hypothetical protein
MGPDEGPSPWAAEQARLALEALRFHWGDAYEIDHAEDGRWIAKRRDGLGGPIEAAGPDGLMAAIADDYNVRKVERP